MRELILGGVALLLLLMGAIIAAILWTAYQNNQAQLERQVTRLTRVLEEQTLNTVRSVDLVLRIIADDGPFELRDHDPKYEDWLRRRLKELPFVRALFVVGADGFITQDTDHPHTPRVSLADRPYFTFHRQHAEGLHVAPPLLSRSVDRWFVAVSRRIDDAEGRFMGIAVAAVEPAFYEQFYAELAGEGDAIALWYADGTLIARMPDDYGRAGQKIGSARIFTDDILSRSADAFTGPSLFDATEERIVSYRRVPDLPLVVAASTSRSPAMAQWRQTVYAALFGFALLCLLGIVMPIILFRRIRDNAEARRRSLLLQKSEALSRMTAGIAHDFNNLLTSIDAGLRLTIRSADDAEKVKSYAAVAEDAVQRGAQLTTQLLSFARGQKSEVTRADANELLTTLQPILRQAAGSGVAANLELAPDLPPCVVDRSQFDAAVLNLVINARDAMPDGGTITIATNLWHQPPHTGAPLAPGRYAVVSVIDTGPGIPPHVAEHIFEPFFTTKGDQGTGLGLAQVFAFMREIGGDVRLARNSPRGATFELYFPCEAEEESGEVRAADPPGLRRAGGRSARAAHL